VTDRPEDDVTTLESPPRAGRGARIPALRPLSPVPTYLGIGVSAIGFILIAVAWGKVAGETLVSKQLPFLVSGGITGLAMVMVGLTVVSVAARRRDAVLREQQTELLADALRELASSLEERHS